MQVDLRLVIPRAKREAETFAQSLAKRKADCATNARARATNVRARATKSREVDLFHLHGSHSEPPIFGAKNMIGISQISRVPRAILSKGENGGGDTDKNVFDSRCVPELERSCLYPVRRICQQC